MVLQKPENGYCATVMILPVSYNMNNIWTSCATISFSVTTMGHEVLNFRCMSIPITFPTLYALHAKRRRHALQSLWPLTYRAGRAVDRNQVGTRHCSLLQNVHATSGTQASSHSWAPIFFTGVYSCCGLAFIIHRHVALWLRWKSPGCTSIYQQLSLYILPSLFLSRYKDADCIKKLDTAIKTHDISKSKNFKKSAEMQRKYMIQLTVFKFERNPELRVCYGDIHIVITTDLLMSGALPLFPF